MKSYVGQRQQKKSSSWLECSKQLLQEFGVSVSEGQTFYFHSVNSLDFAVFLGVYLQAVRQKGRTEYLVPLGEREGLQVAAAAFKGTVSIKRLVVGENGCIDPDTLQEMIRLRTALFPCSLVHPISGVRQPIESLLQICHAVDVPSYVDVTYALGFVGGELHHADMISCDFSVLSSVLNSTQERLPGVDEEMEGVFVWVREGALVDLAPFGNAPSLKLSDKALVVLSKTLELKMPFQLKLPTLRKTFVKRLQELCSLESGKVEEGADGLSRGMTIHFFDFEGTQVPNKVLLGFPDVHGDLLSCILQQEFQVEVGSGPQLQDYLVALGVSPFLAATAISITLPGKVTKQDVCELAENIVQAARQVVHVGGGLCI